MRRVDDESDELEELKKDKRSSYLYLTKERNHAAVWTWRQLRESQQPKPEVPLSLIQEQISLSNWLNRRNDEVLANLTDYHTYAFEDMDNTTRKVSHYDHACESSDSDVEKKQQKDNFGKWTVHYE